MIKKAMLKSLCLILFGITVIRFLYLPNSFAEYLVNNDVFWMATFILLYGFSSLLYTIYLFIKNRFFYHEEKKTGGTTISEFVDYF